MPVLPMRLSLDLHAERKQREPPSTPFPVPLLKFFFKGLPDLSATELGSSKKAVWVPWHATDPHKPHPTTATAASSSSSNGNSPTHWSCSLSKPNPNRPTVNSLIRNFQMDAKPDVGGVTAKLFGFSTKQPVVADLKDFENILIIIQW
ncbi:hypothetical protein CPC08DRAFT_754169 [Agrocybe pediades]|nr:hypothetical protein CPC08DRAFT_754169 [Agrocybe pediades]